MEAALSVDGNLETPLPTVSAARRAFWHDELGEALTDQNRLEEGIDHFRTALGLLGHQVPRSRVGWVFRLVWEVIAQLLHLIAPPRLLRRGDAATLSQASWILSKLGETYYFKSEALPWTATVLAAVNRAERAGNEGLAGAAYSGLANLVGTMRLHRLAGRYFGRSRWKITGQPIGTENPLVLDVLPDRAWQYGLTSTVSEAVYLRTVRRSVDSTPMLDGVVQQSRTFGQNQDLEICLAVRGFFHEVNGTLRSARSDFEELLISARRRGNAEHVVWGMALLVPLLLSLDHRAEALALDDEAAEAFSEDYALFGLVFHGSHVQALLARGLGADAISPARQALRHLGVVPFIHLPGLTAVAQACVEMLENAQGTALDKETRRVGRRALRALRGYVRLYPFARGRYELYLGRYQAAQGRDKAARATGRAASMLLTARDYSRRRPHPPAPGGTAAGEVLGSSRARAPGPPRRGRTRAPSSQGVRRAGRVTPAARARTGPSCTQRWPDRGWARTQEELDGAVVTAPAHDDRRQPPPARLAHRPGAARAPVPAAGPGGGAVAHPCPEPGGRPRTTPRWSPSARRRRPGWTS